MTEALAVQNDQAPGAALVGDLPGFGEEIWRGCSHAWECDEMGHQNVRFYLSQAMDGMAELLARRGLSARPDLHAPQARTVRQYVRLLREVRAGTPLHMRGAICRVDDRTAQLAQLLFHSDSGALAAAIVSDLVLSGGRSSSSTHWPAEMFQTTAELPEICKPRSLDADVTPAALVTLARADTLGLIVGGMGIIDDAACDRFGRLRTQGFTARISDSTRVMTNRFHDVAGRFPGLPTNLGSAGVECRMNYFRYPNAGRRYVVRAGIADINERARRAVYWMLDPESGQPWATLESMELLLDLDARRAVRLPQEAVKAFRSQVVDFACDRIP